MNYEEAQGIWEPDFERGELFWKISPGGNVVAGSEAGHVNAYYGYCIVRYRGRLYRRSRLLWLLKYEKWPEGEVDHKDHNRSRDRISNLRDVTTQGNQRSQSLSKKNTSGVTGVRWVKANKKWRAEIKVDGVSISLGHFEKKQKAIAVRKAAEAMYGFHPNHGKA